MSIDFRRVLLAIFSILPLVMFLGCGGGGAASSDDKKRNDISFEHITPRELAVDAYVYDSPSLNQNQLVSQIETYLTNIDIDVEGCSIYSIRYGDDVNAVGFPSRVDIDSGVARLNFRVNFVENCNARSVTLGALKNVQITTTSTEGNKVVSNSDKIELYAQSSNLNIDSPLEREGIAIEPVGFEDDININRYAQTLRMAFKIVDSNTNLPLSSRDVVLKSISNQVSSNARSGSDGFVEFYYQFSENETNEALTHSFIVQSGTTSFSFNVIQDAGSGSQRYTITQVPETISELSGSAQTLEIRLLLRDEATDRAVANTSVSLKQVSTSSDNIATISPQSSTTNTYGEAVFTITIPANASGSNREYSFVANSINNANLHITITQRSANVTLKYKISTLYTYDGTTIQSNGGDFTYYFLVTDDQSGVAREGASVTFTANSTGDNVVINGNELQKSQTKTTDGSGIVSFTARIPQNSSTSANLDHYFTLSISEGTTVVGLYQYKINQTSASQ